MNFNYKDISGKRILILGGAYQHRKVVRAAKELGLITYVTDYLDINIAPAKQMADFAYKIDINDISGLVELCEKQHIDGVIGPYLDVTQIPYQKLCEEKDYPCFGNEKQFAILTDKALFKQFCVENGADVITSYSEKDIYDDVDIIYPILIKPSDSRGSRGQTVCNNREEAINAIIFARSESKSGGVIIEKYMGTKNDLQLVYVVVNGEPVLMRVEDRYLGEEGKGFDKLCIASIISSKHEEHYRKVADEKIIAMIKKMELKNAPVFIQAFMDGDIARLYDPGLRMPGDDFDDIYYEVTGIDITKLMVYFAITGEFPEGTLEAIRDARIEKATAMILPVMKPGKIAKIDGYEEIEKHCNVLSVSKAYNEGDDVLVTNNVKQRFGEFVISCDNFSQLKDTIVWLFNVLKVTDAKGNDMLQERFDVKLLNCYRK